jgi:hypothetical protein
MLAGWLALAVLLATVDLPESIAAKPNPKPKPPLLPPNANFRGNSLEEWNVLFTEQFVRTNLAGETGVPDTVKKVRFLPAAYVPDDYVFNITIPEGTGLVMPGMFIFGEIYEDSSMDDPNFIFPDEDWAYDPNLGSLAGMNIVDYLYLTAYVQVKYNGKVLLSGVASDLDDYHFGPTYFDSPIVYQDTLPNGAVAAAWCIGVGCVYTPLSKGNHTLEVSTVYDNIFFGYVEFNYVYNIKVKK